MITLTILLRALPCLAALPLIALSLSCGDDDSCNPYDQERITGTVAGPNGPAAYADVHVQSTFAGIVYSVGLNTITDQHGSFVAFVPPGSYLLSVDPPSGYSEMWYAKPNPVFRRADAETLDVHPGGEPVIADFTLGGLDIQLGMPPGLDYGTIGCHLYDAGGTRGATSAAPVEQSTASFTFDYLTPGTYTALLSVNTLRPYGTINVWLPGAFDPSSADSIEVTSLELEEVQVDFPQPGRLRGTVQGCWDPGTSYPPLIRAYGPGPRLMSDQYVNGRGEFDIPVFAEGEFRLALTAGGRTQWIGGDDYDHATAYDVAPGSDAVAEVHVSCIVCNVTGCSAEGGCSARISVLGYSGHGVAGGEIGCDGKITFSNLNPGSYFLNIRPNEPQAWRPQWFERAALYEDATPVVIETAGETVEVTFILEPGGTILGRVLDEDGGGAAGLDLEVFGLNTAWNLGGLSKTEMDGSFHLEGLPDDDIRIGVRHAFPDNNKVTWYPGTADPDSAELITIVDAGEVAGVEWQIQ